MSSYDILDRLMATIAERAKNADPKSSHVAKMVAKGTPKIAKKLGEEAVETAIAAMMDGRDEVIKESADMLFHLLVLWHVQGIKAQEVMEELARREGISGIAEKAGRAEG